MLVAFSSPVKVSKSAFTVWNFEQSLSLYYKCNFCQSSWITRNQNFSAVKCVADSDEIVLQKFTQLQQWLERKTGLKLPYLSLKIVQRDTQDYAPLQRRATNTTNRQTNSYTTSKILIEFTHSDFPCHLKVNKDKLVLISCLWKCKKGERSAITFNSFTKIDQLNGHGLDEKIRSFSKPRRRWRQERHQRKSLISRTMASARAFWILVHFFAVLCKTITWNDQVLCILENASHNG